jgi:hypothetical protein
MTKVQGVVMLLVSFIGTIIALAWSVYQPCLWSGIWLVFGIGFTYFLYRAAKWEEPEND